MAMRKFWIVFCVLFVGHFGLILSTITDSLLREDEQLHSFEMRQEIHRFASHRISKRSLRHRRDAGSSDPKCMSQEQTFNTSLKQHRDTFAHKYMFDNETKFSMALAWAGENDGTILVVTTEEMLIFAKPSTLYRSTDYGKTFSNINHKVKNAFIRKTNGLQKHPYVPQKVYLLCHPAHSILGQSSTISQDMWITDDGGNSFQKYQLPFLLQGALVFHPNRKYVNWVLALDQSKQMLYLSKDGGKAWLRIQQQVSTFKWTSGENGDSPGTIYATIGTKANLPPWMRMYKRFSYELQKSSDLGVTWTTIHSSVYTFGVQGRFLYASIKIPTDSAKRLMKVSHDGGKTWYEAQLPTITSDRFYSILDMSEGLIFMHVDNPGDTGQGTLYTSDSTGIIFSESLQKHLYPNYIDLTDFYKVKSMRGVYLASQMADDKSIHTMITFNRGAEWKNIQRPVGVPCKDESKPCFLQIHNMYSMSRGVKAQAPLTVENAPGIIMVHGHVAEALQTTPPDVFVTSDGGYTWIKALDGPHHYQIMDHGGLLVAIAANTTTPDTVKFSTDEGRCWHSYKFTSEKIIFTGLLTEPGNKAMSMGVWGFGATDRVWRVHVIDFQTVIPRQCGVQDYEDWIPHGDAQMEKQAKYRGCLLGQKETFKRLKKDSWCYNGYSHVASKTQQKCECTKEDYECDYGYYRQPNSLVCQADPNFKGTKLDICERHERERIITQGYRKIPGDQCRGGYKPAGEKLVDLHEKCKGIKVIKGKNAENAKSTLSGGASHSQVVIAAIVLLILFLAVIMTVYFVHKFKLLRRTNVSYRYSMLNQGGDYDYDNDFEQALATHSHGTSLYEDSSDEEGAEKKPSSTTNSSPSRTAGSTSTQRPKVSPQQQNNVMPKPKVKQYHDDSDDDMLE